MMTKLRVIKFLSPNIRFSKNRQPSLYLNTSTTAAIPLPSTDKLQSNHVNSYENYSYFPWRTVPSTSTDTFRTMINSTFSSFFVSFFFFESSLYWATEFNHGANTVFKITLDSIFSSISGSNIILDATSSDVEIEEKESNKDNIQDKKNTVPSQSIEDAILTLDNNLVFEEKLGKFYLDAISNMKKSSHILHYQLISSDKPYIVKYETIFNADRNKDMKDFVKASLFGLLAAKKKKANNSYANNEDFRLITTRVWVRFPCREIFMVKDAITDHVIQGSPNVIDAEHELLLETCLAYSDELQVGEWRVVDIDRWLDGNEFLFPDVPVTEKENDKEA